MISSRFPGLRPGRKANRSNRFEYQAVKTNGFFIIVIIFYRKNFPIQNMFNL